MSRFPCPAQAWNGLLGTFLVGDLLLGQFLLTSCQARAPKEQAAQPFMFRSLNLQQKDLLGLPSWTITSPETRYDLGRRVAQARDIQGVLYAHGQRRYRLSAPAGTVLNDGEIVQLEGQIRIDKFGPNPFTIRARQARWYPSQKLLLLDHRPIATQGNLQLSAKRLRFLIDQDQLELRGQPELQRRGENGIRLKVKTADWNTATGEIQANGPVVGVRGLPKQQQQRLSAPSLSGNSQVQQLTLAAPVRLTDSEHQAVLKALTTQVDLAQQIVSSSLPFHGTMKRTTITGTGFELFSRSHTAVITSKCVLSQPTDSLKANRCTWNWQTDQVRARGAVELKRQGSQQITRAERIDGRLGREGLVVFTSPGSRVNTQLQIPEKTTPSSRPGSKSAPRAANPPIEL